MHKTQHQQVYNLYSHHLLQHNNRHIHEWFNRFVHYLPWSMVTVTRIFRRNFAAYGRLRQETVRKQAVYCRDRDHRNMAPYTISYLRRIRSSSWRVLIIYGCKPPTWNTIKYGA
jgi:hypothetical protein